MNSTHPGLWTRYVVWNEVRSGSGFQNIVEFEPGFENLVGFGSGLNISIKFLAVFIDQGTVILIIFYIKRKNFVL